MVAASLAHAARRDADDVTADLVDQTIARELRKRLPDSAHAELLEAAGNAGCSACSGSALHDLRSPSIEVRLSALAALRFVSVTQAASGMCAVLLDDSMTDVREQAAWSLRWARSSIRERVECLITSAARDASARVRQMATASLGLLGRSEPLARSALLHLTSAEYDPNVSAVAQRALDASGRDIDWSDGPLPGGP